MIPQRLLMVIFAVLVTYDPSFGQLGPKDGAKLTPTDLERVQVGQAAPDFTLEEMNGKQITLSHFRGRKNVVLVFYRGHW